MSLYQFYLELFVLHIRGMLRRQGCLIMKKVSNHDRSHEEIPGQQCS